MKIKYWETILGVHLFNKNKFWRCYKIKSLDINGIPRISRIHYLVSWLYLNLVLPLRLYIFIFWYLYPPVASLFASKVGHNTIMKKRRSGNITIYEIIRDLFSMLNRGHTSSASWAETTTLDNIMQQIN